MKRFDKLYIGILVGTFLPVLGFIFGHEFIYHRHSWKSYWAFFLNPGDVQTQIFTFCMLPTLFLFYFVNFRWKLDHASKGLVMISLIYISVFAYLKFI